MNSEELARKINMPPAALDEVVDCIEGKYDLPYIRKTLRSDYGVKMSHQQWAAIKEWFAGQGSLGK